MGFYMHSTNMNEVQCQDSSFRVSSLCPAEFSAWIHECRLLLTIEKQRMSRTGEVLSWLMLSHV